MTEEKINIRPDDWKKVSKTIDQEGKKKGFTDEQYKENVNRNKSIVITWGTWFGIFIAVIVLLMIVAAIAWYFYLIAQNPTTFCKAMETWGMVFLVGLFSNCTSGFFKNLFLKIFK